MGTATRISLIVVCIGAVAVPAFAKGKPPTTGAGCRPQAMVVLSGTLASTPGAAATSVAVTVAHANHHGAAYLKLGQPLSIGVDTRTKIRRQGGKTLADLRQGDRVVVHAKACKADLKSGTPALTAKSIVAHDPSTPGDGKGKDKD